MHAKLRSTAKLVSAFDIKRVSDNPWHIQTALNSQDLQNLFNLTWQKSMNKKKNSFNTEKK